jgi:hypothetical protein
VRKFGIVAALVVLMAAATYLEKRDDTFLAEVVQAMSEPGIAVSLCPVKCSSISAPCVAVDQAETAIAQLRGATRANSPGHGQQSREYVLKITSGGDKPKNTCFLLVEYKGWEDRLYLSKIDTGQGCSETQFKYGVGTVSVGNFLRAGNSARRPNAALPPTVTSSACPSFQVPPAQRG